MTRRRSTLIALVCSAVVAAGCASSDSVESTVQESTVPPDSTTTTVPVETTTTIEPTTTVADTTTTVADTTTTVADTTTTAPTTAPSSTVPSTPAPEAPATAVVLADSALVEVDVATGDVVATLDEFFGGDGVFRGGLRRSADAATIWFSEGYEDGWYGCETSVGSVGRFDVATGAVEIVGVGYGLEISPDGAFIAYVSSDLCLPDPENPEFWVLTPYDRAVVRELATGTQWEFATDAELVDYSSPGQVEWTGFTPDGDVLVLTADGALRAVDLEGSGVLQEHPVALSDVRGVPIGTTADALVTIDVGDEGSADVYSVDPLSGVATLLASSESYLSAGLAPTGAIVVSGFDEVTVEPGAPVTVLTAPDGVTYYDVDW